MRVIIAPLLPLTSSRPLYRLQIISEPGNPPGLSNVVVSLDKADGARECLAALVVIWRRTDESHRTLTPWGRRSYVNLLSDMDAWWLFQVEGREGI